MPFNRLFPLLLALFTVASLHAQDYNAYVKTVTSNVAKINNDKTLLVLKATDASGAELTGYFLFGRELVRITAQIKTSWGIILNEYYFEKDKLVYAYESEKKEMPDPETDELKLNVTYTAGYYYMKDQVIKENQVVGLKQPLAKKESRLPLLKASQQFAATLYAKLKETGQ